MLLFIFLGGLFLLTFLGLAGSWLIIPAAVVWLALVYIYGTMFIYRLGDRGKYLVTTPVNAFLAIMVGRNVVRGYVTPPDLRTEKYFKWLKKHTPQGHLYRIISPGRTGLGWKGLDEKTSVPEIADTRELKDVTPEILHALRMQERELTFEFEPSEEELRAIRNEVAEVQAENAKAGRKVRTIDAAKVRKLAFTPNMRTADQIEIKSRNRLFLESVHPVLSLTEIEFPQDMLRGRIMPAYREVVAGLDYYQALLRNTGSQQNLQRSRELLLVQVQARFRESLGFKDPTLGAPKFGIFDVECPDAVTGDEQEHWNEYWIGKPYFLFTIEELTKIKAALSEEDWNELEFPTELEGEFPANPFQPNSIMDRILRDWGYYIRDVLVEDVAEVEEKITAALVEAVAASAEATRDRRRAEGRKAARVLDGQAEREFQKLVAAGDIARILAWKSDNPEMAEAIKARLAQIQSDNWTKGVSTPGDGKTVVVGAPGSSIDGLTSAAAALGGVLSGPKNGTSTEAKKKAAKPGSEANPEEGPKSES